MPCSHKNAAWTMGGPGEYDEGHAVCTNCGAGYWPDDEDSEEDGYEVDGSQTGRQSGRETKP